MNPSSERSFDSGRAPHRLSELEGLVVRFANGEVAGYVLDVRLAPSDRLRGGLTELVSDGLVVGRHRHTALLGYDRKEEQGPWIIRVVMRRLHRRSGYVPWSAVRDVDVAGAGVRLDIDQLEPLGRP